MRRVAKMVEPSTKKRIGEGEVDLTFIETHGQQVYHLKLKPHWNGFVVETDERGVSYGTLIFIPNVRPQDAVEGL